MIRALHLAFLLAAPLAAQDEGPRIIDVTKLVMVTPLSESPFEGCVILLRRNGDFTIAKISAIKTAVAGKITIPHSAIMVDCYSAPLVIKESYVDVHGGTHTVTVTGEDGQTKAECQKELDEMMALMKQSWPPKARQ